MSAPTTDRTRRICAEYAAGGVSYSDLARRHGVSKAAVGQVIARYGLRPSYEKWLANRAAKRGRGQ